MWKHNSCSHPQNIRCKWCSILFQSISGCKGRIEDTQNCPWREMCSRKWTADILWLGLCSCANVFPSSEHMIRCELCWHSSLFQSINGPPVPPPSPPLTSNFSLFNSSVMLLRTNLLKSITNSHGWQQRPLIKIRINLLLTFPTNAQSWHCREKANASCCWLQTPRILHRLTHLPRHALL